MSREQRGGIPPQPHPGRRRDAVSASIITVGWFWAVSLVGPPTLWSLRSRTPVIFAAREDPRAGLQFPKNLQLLAHAVILGEVDGGLDSGE